MAEQQVTFNMTKTMAKNPHTGEDSEGYTIFVDGQLKELFDKMISMDSKTYPDYGNVVAKCLAGGIAGAVNRLNRQQQNQ